MCACMHGNIAHATHSTITHATRVTSYTTTRHATHATQQTHILTTTNRHYRVPGSDREGAQKEAVLYVVYRHRVLPEEPADLLIRTSK